MFIGLLIIIIYSIFLSYLFKKTTAETLFMSVAGTIFVLYVFGILNLYIIGVILLLILALIAFIFLAYKSIKEKTLEYIKVDYGMIGFLCLSIVIYFVLKGSKIICLDEFTAWGLFAKDTYMSKKLYIYSELPALAKNYQSATAIFQSFFEVLNFKFKEDVMLIANDIIYLSMASFIFKNKSRLIQYFINTCIVLLMPLTMLMWPTVYNTILVDIILGLGTGYVIFYYFNSKLETFTFINIALGIFFLSCSKLNGILLSLICLGVIYADIVLFKRKEMFSYIKIKKKYDIKRILILVLPILSMIFTYLSWVILISIINVKKASGDGGSMLDLLFSWKTTPFKAWVLDFIKVVKNIIMNYRNFMIFIFALFMIIFSIKKPKKEDIKRNLVAITLLIITECLYVYILFAVCSTMRNSFIAVEALRRYLYTLVAADLFILLYTMMNIGINIKRVSIAFMVLIISWLTTDASYQAHEFLHKQYTKNSIDYRKSFDESIKKIKKIDTLNNIVYVISDKEVVPYIINYELLPGSVSIYNKSKIEKITSKKNYKVYRLNIVTKEEKKYLKDKTKGDIYIYIYDYNEYQKEIYEDFFETPMEKETLYKIQNVDGVDKAVLYNN